MPQFFEFVINHWFLWSLFVLVAVALIWQEMQAQSGGSKQVSPQEATKLINKENAIVLDIRTQEQFQQGHITNAINIDPAGELKKLQKYKKRVVIIVCNDGTKSGKFAKQLQTEGFEKICTLQGGISNWRNSNMPLIKS